MASKKQVILVILISASLVGLLGWWIDFRTQPSEIILEGHDMLDAPLVPEELEVTNPIITNDMNRTATLHTNKGNITLELFEDMMPITTGNFVKLAEEGFYDDTKFHRIIDGFMIQAGDPNSKGDDASRYGTGGPGYTIQDEFVAGDHLSNTRGTISMANTGQPNSGGSQFFINTVDNLALDFDKEPLSSKHPVFGKVLEGLDVVDSISNAETGQGDLPVEPIVIESISIATQ